MSYPRMALSNIWSRYAINFPLLQFFVLNGIQIPPAEQCTSYDSSVEGQSVERSAGSVLVVSRMAVFRL